MYCDDFAGESIIPLGRLAAFPRSHLPIFAFGNVTETHITEMATRAAALGEIMGSLATTLGVAADSSWLFADAAFGEFGKRCR